MQLATFAVQGLFGRHNHVIHFPTSSEDDSKPSVVILHGPNGIGKTTVLKMVSGVMAMDFSTFRAVPFSEAHLTFNDGQRVDVKKIEDGVLHVTFGDESALLNPTKSGPWREEDLASVTRYRAAFELATSTITYEYLSTKRVQPDDSAEDVVDPETGEYYSLGSDGELLRRQRLVRARRNNRGQGVLADQVKRFIADAQLDHSSFFRSNDPDLFMRILGDLTAPAPPSRRREDIRKSLERANELDQVHARLGLGRDSWDFDGLIEVLEGIDADKDNGDHALTAIAAYSEFIESRATTRELVAERLVTFERAMADFLADKRVSVNARDGVVIRSQDGETLTESQLSSGEYQLLYLMVTALTTRRRGTVIAIDEPELSMHIGWQRRLVPNLIRCASRAAPQFILATHSPDIAAGYPESMVELGVASDA